MPPILLPHRAESEALKLKWIMHRGKWVEAEYLLTRSPSGLSDRPVNKETTK